MPGRDRRGVGTWWSRGAWSVVVEQELSRQPAIRRRFDVRLPARPESVAAARLALEVLHIPAWLRGDARLLLTELVTNSVRHAGLSPQETVRVQAEWTGWNLRVRVQDRPRESSSSVVGAIRPSPTGESGWGLYLVERLAKRWGIDGQGGYWFELDAADED
jgi:anti-sigma regulatory factor (Ser/Thr protein kinase)